MRNYWQKFFLIFLLNGSLLISGMEIVEFFKGKYDQYQLDTALADTVIKAENNKFTDQDCQAIINYIEQGADFNCETKNGMTLAGVATKYLNIDLLQCLIRYNADINKKDKNNFTPLQYLVENQNIKNLEIIKKLCNAGASLITNELARPNKETIFHYLVIKHMPNLTTEQIPKNYIETIITHARFDIYNKEIDEQLKKQVMTALLVFNNNSKLPKLLPEIQYRILSYLALDYFDGFNKKLCKKLGLQKIIFTHLENKIENIEKMLQFSSIFGIPCKHSVKFFNMTAVEYWNAKLTARQINDDHNLEILYLLDGSKLRNDMIVFKNSFPKLEQIPKDNLILKIYDA